VANHASYLDGLVLSAVLPPSFSFVAKQELSNQFVAGVFLRRIGTRFVERFDPRRSSEDTSRLSEYVRQGHSLVIMPEGTFSRTPGLRPFRMGAFVVAVEAGVPVIPVAIRGTRSILRGNSRFPRRGLVSINIGKPIHPAGSDWSAAIQLRDRARKEILHYCGEPDLSDVSLLSPEP
jgi:1-acyl-sn-glycerol-3-phosphate acyltransferase